MALTYSNHPMREEEREEREEDQASTAMLNELTTERAILDLEDGSGVEDDDGHDTDREGRFHGPDSSWKYYTRDIRALASSLENIQNNDLSIHLYNAHALKTHCRLQKPNPSIVPHRGKRSWRAPLQDMGSALYPPNSWTSWPLPPADVPRQREAWGVPTEHPREQSGTYFKPQNWKPSMSLEDEINALTLRIAKEQVQRQVWADSSSEQDSSTDGPPSGSDRQHESADSTSGDSSRSAEGNLAEEASGKDPERLAGRSVVSLGVDEEANSRLLRPSTRHIISQVDDLLLGLHNNRQGHRVSRPRLQRIRNESRTKPSAQSESPAKRRRIETDSDAEIDNDDRTAVADASDSRDVGLRKSGSPGKRDPRDWSEVLSIAALVGWDSKVIQRAARRCTAVFGEGMGIRLMPEANHEPDHIDRYVSKVPPLDLTTEGSDNDTSSVSDSATASSEARECPHRMIGDTALRCPETGCSRGSTAFTTLWRLREHLKRKHKYSQSDIDTLVPRTERAIKTSGHPK